MRLRPEAVCLGAGLGAGTLSVPRREATAARPRMPSGDL